MRTYLELAGVLLAGLIGWYLHSEGVKQGRLECQAETTETTDQARSANDASNRTASEINASAQTWLWGALPPIDLRTQEARDRVQIIYRNAEADPTLDRCLGPARPASVQAELNEARGRVIAAARSALRASTVSESQSRARLHQDHVLAMRQGHGRLRVAAARNPRDRGGQGPGLAFVRE